MTCSASVVCLCNKHPILHECDLLRNCGTRGGYGTHNRVPPGGDFLYLPSQLEVVRKKLPSAPSSAAFATRPRLMSEPAHTAELHLASTWGGLASSPLRHRPVERSSQRQQRRLDSLANNSDSPGNCATQGTAPQRSGCLIKISGTHRFCWPGVVLLAMVIMQAPPTEPCASQPLPGSSLCDDSSRIALTALVLTSCSNLLDAGLQSAV